MALMDGSMPVRSTRLSLTGILDPGGESHVWPLPISRILCTNALRRRADPADSTESVRRKRSDELHDSSKRYNLEPVQSRRVWVLLAIGQGFLCSVPFV